MNKFFSISWWGRGNILKVRWKSFPLNQIYMGKKKSNRIPVLFLAGKKKKKAHYQGQKRCSDHNLLVLLSTHLPSLLAQLEPLPSSPSLTSLASHHPFRPFSSTPTQLHTPCLSNFYPFEVHHILCAITLSICGRCFTLCITSLVQFLKSFCSLIQKHYFY